VSADEPRTQPPLAGDELATLTGFLDHHRDTLRVKATGLDHAALHTPLAPTTMTLGGLLHHLAFVEDHWLRHLLLGQERAEPWAGVDREADPDWEWTVAPEVPDEQLWSRWEHAVGSSRAVVARVVAEDGDAALDRLCVRGRHDGERASLRWVLVHLVEEYARHNGHADLLREALDGTRGE
jgi:uncharacterized damage-inducible protein DinB